MEQWIDGPQPIRPGEELDVAALERYLTLQRPELQHSLPLEVKQFPGGSSNLTYWLRIGDNQYVLRRPPFGNQVKSAHDMGREYRVLDKLCQVYAAAPRPLVYCEDQQVLGAPFYIMEYRRGLILRRKLPEGLVIDPPTARRLCESFIDNLVLLHRIDYRAAGLEDLGRPVGYVGRQVDGWIKRYAAARTDESPPMESTIAWIQAHQPPDGGAAIVHNDYKYDNIILDPADPTRILGVLDWEMCTLGDPLMDLGATLAYWVQADDSPLRQHNATGPTMLPGSLTRRQLAERYAQQTGADISQMLFYYGFGLFKLAVIVQQIYARYVRGHTQDPRFAKLHQWVSLLDQTLTEAIETETY